MPFDTSSGVEDRMDKPRVENVWIVDIPSSGTTSVGGNEFHLTNWTESITFPSGTGHKYTPMQFDVGSIEYEASASIPRRDITFSNVTKKISNMLHDDNGLVNEQVRLRTILPGVLASGSEVRDQEWIIHDTGFTNQAGTITLASHLDDIDRRLTRRIDHETFPNIPRTPRRIRVR